MLTFPHSTECIWFLSSGQGYCGGKGREPFAGSSQARVGAASWSAAPTPRSLLLCQRARSFGRGRDALSCKNPSFTHAAIQLPSHCSDPFTGKPSKNYSFPFSHLSLCLHFGQAFVPSSPLKWLLIYLFICLLFLSTL